MHRRKHASTPIEDDSSHNISDSQKKHYTSIGYKPYRSYSGKIKWLSYEQHLYEKIKYAYAKHSHSVRKNHRYNKKRQNYWRLFIRFIRTNLFLLIVLILLFIALLNHRVIIDFLTNLSI